MRATGLAAVVITLLLGCASPQTRQVKSLMESPVAPASDAIFNAVIYTNGQLAASPTTDGDWERLRQHAESLVTAAATLTSLAPSTDPTPWIQQSDALGEASSAALAAVNARSLVGVLEAGSRVYNTCTSCHAVYVKDP